MEWTTKEESEKLIGLGINSRTADLTLKAITVDSRGFRIENPDWEMIVVPFYKHIEDTPKGFESYKYIPSWTSLQLFELLPETMKDEAGYEYILNLNHEYVYYENPRYNNLNKTYCYFPVVDGEYKPALINMIEFLKSHSKL
jgi:hypothetical protein